MLRTKNAFLFISTLTLGACAVTSDGAGPVPVAESARVIDSTIASQTRRPDSAFDVTCADGGQEIDSAEQIAAGLACVAARSATAHFFHMFMTEAGGGWSASGPLTTGVDVTLKVMGTNVSAVFFDRSGDFARPLTAATVSLAADGSFTATTNLVSVDAGCPSLFIRTTDRFTVSGRIDVPYGTAALDNCSFFHERAGSNRRRFTCDPDGTWLTLDDVWYDAQAPADPATLSE